MTRKFLLGFSLALLLFVLAGCIKIPVGDGELEISQDGIEFHVDLDENDDAEPQKNDDFDLISNHEMDHDTNNDESENFNNNGDSNAEDAEMMGQGGPGLGVCDEPMDHNEFLVYVNYDYWIPACAEVFDVHPYDDRVVGQFEIHQGANWEAVTYEYMAYLEQEGELTKDEIDDEAEWEWADLEGVLSNGRETRIEIQHQIGDYVEFHITYYYPGG